MLGVFHNWGRQLQHHPHLHFIVPGGGLTPDGKAWRAARRPDWLLPKAAVEAGLRGGMEAALRAAAPDLHAQVPEVCWREGWWVHWQPAGFGESVVKYLARYVQQAGPLGLVAWKIDIALPYKRNVSPTRRSETLRRYVDSAQFAATFFGANIERPDPI